MEHPELCHSETFKEFLFDSEYSEKAKKKKEWFLTKVFNQLTSSKSKQSKVNVENLNSLKQKLNIFREVFTKTHESLVSMHTSSFSLKELEKSASGNTPFFEECGLSQLCSFLKETSSFFQGKCNEDWMTFARVTKYIQYDVENFLSSCSNSEREENQREVDWFFSKTTNEMKRAVQFLIGKIYLFHKNSLDLLNTFNQFVEIYPTPVSSPNSSNRARSSSKGKEELEGTRMNSLPFGNQDD